MASRDLKARTCKRATVRSTSDSLDAHAATADERTAARPEPDFQLLDAIDKANKRIETERERIFDAGALVEVLSRSMRDPQDDPFIRACNQIYAQLDTV